MFAISDRKSAAVMFTDIVKATDMMAKDEEKAIALLKEKRTILQPIIEKHDGIYVKGTGDGSLSYFDSPYKASLCAQIFQQNIYDREDLNVRVGIHVGDIVFDEGDVYGDGVNVAKRLESMAPDGGICVSNSVYDELRNKKEFDGIDLGLQTLKGIGRLVEVFGLEGDKINAPNPNNYHENKVRVHTHDEVPSVAIIPFRNKGKEEEEFYAYGICSELISDVSSAGLIRVASLEKIMELGELSASEKAEQLNVRYITTGMLWKMGDMFQLSIELYDSRDSKVIWSDQWQENWDNLSTIKGNLSAGLLKALNTENTIDYKSVVINPEAYKYYLEAQYKYDNLEYGSEYEVIRELLKKCLLMDEHILEAKSLLAETYFDTNDNKTAKELCFEIIKEGEETEKHKIVASILRRLGQSCIFIRDFEKALEYINRALEIAKSINYTQCIAESTCSLGWIYAEGGFKSTNKVFSMFESGMEIFNELEDIKSQIFTYLDMSFIRMEEIDKSRQYVESAYELAKNSGNKVELSLAQICLGYHYSIWGGKYEQGDDLMKSGIKMSKEMDDKKMESLGMQVLGESLYQQEKFQESLHFNEEAFSINEEINLKLWRLGAVLGISINRKKLGLEIEFDILNKELEQKYNKSNNYITQTYIDYCQYIIYEETKYLQMAYDGVMKISDKLEVKDRDKFLNSPWMKILIEAWEKNNKL